MSAPSARPPAGVKRPGCLRGFTVRYRLVRAGAAVSTGGPDGGGGSRRPPAPAGVRGEGIPTDFHVCRVIPGPRNSSSDDAVFALAVFETAEVQKKLFVGSGVTRVKRSQTLRGLALWPAETEL